MESPKVSVIIPVYGVEQYIGRCCDSLFRQTMKENIEFIFVNDASPDNSVKVISDKLLEYPERKHQVKIIEHKKNQGLAAARKTGIKEAKGKYIIHCDSDDWVEPDMYKKMYDTGEADDADIIICDYYVNYLNSQVIMKQSVPNNRVDLVQKLLRGDFHNNVWSKMIRKEIYDKFPSVYEEGINMWEDVSVISRLAFYCNNISYLPLPLYHYSQENENAHTHKWKPQFTDNILRAVDKNKTFFKNTHISTAALEQRAYYSILCNASHSERKQLLETIRGSFNHIDYSIYSPYRKLVAWCLFHSHNRLADGIMGFKQWLVKKLR